MATSKNDFYVYAYIDPRNDEPFYIGKGRGPRIDAHLQRSSRKKPTFMANKIRKLREENVNPVRRILLECLDEASAFYFESFFIKSIGRRDCRTGPLTNLTDGGDGVSNPSDDIRRRMSVAIKAAMQQPDVKARNTAAQQANNARPEVRAKKSAAHLVRKPRGQYKGVSRRGRGFMARIKLRPHHYYLGYYSQPEQAAKVYDAVARVLASGGCYINFPVEEEWWDSITQERPGIANSLYDSDAHSG